MSAPATARRAVAAAVVGNVLEWYDFAVYGYVAAIIGRTFFPTGDATTELLASFGAFGVGFLARPLGGIVIGRIGDVRGRKTALLLTIFLMAGGTALVGLIPTYGRIGMAAPLLVVLARLVQGFSAGGEWGGSTAFIVEWAPEGRRGFYGSLQQCSVAGGLLLGSGTSALLTTVLAPQAMETWGWRVLFLLGGLLGPVGLWMRRGIEETPAYVSVRESEDRTDLEADRRAGGSVSEGSTRATHPVILAGRAFGFTILWTVSYYIFLNYMPTFVATYGHLTEAQALWSNTLGIVVLVVAIPLMGTLSDRVGRRPLLLLCCAAFVVSPWPVATLLVAGPPFAAVVALQLGLGAIIALFSGAGPAAIAEIFPTRSRSTWMTTGYALAVAIFGGFAPTIATWLIRATGSPVAWVYYVMAAAMVSGVVIWRLEETAHRPLA
ncbi:MAG: MFS transporter [Gemmatimonadetes bacterium]|nr:MFS transporter [Gemmatimonadota bacterium]